MADTSLWVNEGDVLHSPLLSEKMRFAAQPMLRFRRFVDVKPAFGMGNGDTFNWDKTADVANPGGKLVETTTFHQTSQTPTKGTLTVYEYGNSIPYTFKMRALASFDIERIVKKGLADDMAKITDASAERKFNATKLRYVGSSTTTHALTTNGTATATNSSVLNEYHVRKMRLELEKRNVKEISNGFIGIFSLEAVEGLMGAEKSTNQYTETGYSKIIEGEIGMLNGVRIIKENNATRNTYNLDNRTKTADSWTNSLSLNGYVFGQDNIVEAIAVPEEVRAKEVTDYGRSRGLAWYTIMGHEIVWNTAADSKIIKWDSAA
jgi:N4-gp56 family major capsid protein